MRGSVYYQSSVLVKCIFQEGAKKFEKIDLGHSYYQKISSYKTMESYRNIWNNFLHYVKEHWDMKDCEQINSHHISSYMDYKIEYYPSQKYVQKISSALGKLEIALNKYSKETYLEPRHYDFSIRQKILDESRELNLIVNNYHNRAYKDPLALIHTMTSPQHKIAASIEYEGGARVEACSLIKQQQLLGYELDKVTNTKKGVVFTKEKGGKEGNIYIGVETYQALDNYIAKNGTFKINRQRYFEAIRDTCNHLNISSEGTHGLRWNFAQRRLFEYAEAGYTYEQSLQSVSWEMKHNRASITEHYIG